MRSEFDRMSILGVGIDNFSKAETNDWIKNILGNPPERKFIATLNPEIVLKGYRDKDCASVLNGADLALCDGFGIKFAVWLKGGKIRARYTGVDLTDFLLKRAKEKNTSTLVVVSEDSLSSPGEIRRKIGEKYGFQARAEYFAGENFFENRAAKSAQIVFVNFGAPRQEKFIFENRAKFPEARVIVGVGGAFDFLTGKMKRAPRWMRKAGFEWLFRLWREPKRAKRIWNAVFVFPCLAVLNRRKK